ncbi:hypothetical protein ACFJIV_20570 [Mucilaginibacter sp. UC70_90]
MDNKENINLEKEAALDNAIAKGLDDVKHGRITPHEIVMNEIKKKYNYDTSSESKVDELYS